MTRMPQAERRAALVEAALRVMGRGGLTAGTTRAIVAEAGMPLASFHYAFRSRDELLREVVHRVVGRELAGAVDAWDGTGGLPGCLCAAADGYLAQLERDPEHELLMFELMVRAVRDPGLRPLAAQQYRAYTQAATRLLQRAAEATGTGWRRPVPELARLLVMLVDGATTTWFADRDTAATRAALHASVELFVGQHAERAA